jgi:hypothetical protein
MKKILKYGIFILFVVMLHSLVMTAAKVSSSAPTTGHAEEIGNAQSMQTVLLRQFCYLYSHLACDAAHIDKCYTLQYKVLIRFVNGYCAYKPESLFSCYHPPHPSLFSSTSLKTYYVFGLRKILI